MATINPLTHSFNGQATITLISTPDTCPVCGYGIEPRLIGAALKSSNAKQVSVCFCCVRNECHDFFLATYDHTPNGTYRLEKVYPRTMRNESFPESITSISPSFASIFNQALQAEILELSQIAGIGFRKSVEFLIKDYLIYKNQSDRDSIVNTFLGKCITEYLPDGHIKEVAKRATWLGNDETHYTRKWENKDISDLKTLIRIAINFIDSEVQTQKYIQEMAE